MAVFPMFIELENETCLIIGGGKVALRKAEVLLDMGAEVHVISREFEPDGPNYTPRISGIMHIENGGYNFAMSILKSDDGCPDSCNRFTYAYENPAAGKGRFIHTYMHDGNPLPSFEGEPKLVDIPNDMDEF